MGMLFDPISMKVERKDESFSHTARLCTRIFSKAKLLFSLRAMLSWWRNLYFHRNLWKVQRYFLYYGVCFHAASLFKQPHKINGFVKLVSITFVYLFNPQPIHFSSSSEAPLFYRNNQKSIHGFSIGERSLGCFSEYLSKGENKKFQPYWTNLPIWSSIHSNPYLTQLFK